MPLIDRFDLYLKTFLGEPNDFTNPNVAEQYPPDLELEPVHLDIDLYVDVGREEARGRVRVGLTINEYVQTFHSAWVVANLRVFAGLITWKWYGNGHFDESDYRRCRKAFEAIESKLEETA